MAINKVDLTVSQLINDLNEGYTWLKKDDLGYGSIEVKYNANPNQIAKIRKHPKLKDADTTITVFNIIDDTSSIAIESHSDQMIEIMNKTKEVESVTAVLDASDAFANL